MFKKVFGTDKKSIRKNCIILPLNDKSLFEPLVSGIYSRGMFYDVSYSEEYSVIYLKHMYFAGDCVLMMEDTVCENIFLFGSCGALKGEIGDKVIVEKSLNLESFTDFLNTDDLGSFDTSAAHKSSHLWQGQEVPLSINPERPKGVEWVDFYCPDKELLKRFVDFTQGRDYRKCTCGTVSSLVLEERRANILSDSGIDCVDMESSMVFSAASKIKRKAIAVFYVADTVGRINFYDRYDADSRKKIKGSRKSIARRLIKFLSDELT